MKTPAFILLSGIVFCCDMNSSQAQNADSINPNVQILKSVVSQEMNRKNSNIQNLKEKNMDNKEDVNTNKDGLTPLMVALKNNEPLEKVADLINQEKNIDAVDHDGTTALMWAASKNSDYRIIKALAERGAEIDVRDKQGATALMFAAANNPNRDVALTLVELGADVDLKMEGSSPLEGYTPLMLAAKFNGEDVFDVLLRCGADFDVENKEGKTVADLFENNPKMDGTNISFIFSKLRDNREEAEDNGLTPLMYMAKERYFLPFALERAIKLGADVNAQDEQYGWTALMYAANENDNVEIVNTLLKAGADVNARNSDGGTPIFGAVFTAERPRFFSYSKDEHLNSMENLYDTKLDNIEVIKSLIEHGADVNARNDRDQTVLMFASATNRNPQVIETLIKNGADVNAQNKNGLTALMSAAQYNHNLEIIDELIKQGADVNVQTQDGLTALMLASVYNNASIVETLIKNGADVNSTKKNGATPLMFAVGYAKYQNIIALLLKNGADIKARTKSNMTVLMYAVSNNPDPRVTEFLLEKGVDINAQDEEGRTALMFASRDTENPEVIEMLLKHGADVKVKNNDGETALDYAQENPDLDETDVYQKMLTMLK